MPANNSLTARYFRFLLTRPLARLPHFEHFRTRLSEIIRSYSYGYAEKKELPTDYQAVPFVNQLNK